MSIPGSPDISSDEYDQYSNIDSALADLTVYANDAVDHKEAYIAFTFNPDPQKYRSNDPIEQYKSLLLCLFLKRDIIHTFTKFIFIPELTKMGNVHIHGYFAIRDAIKYHKWFIPACKQWGKMAFYVKKNVDEYWMYDYMCKEVHMLADTFEDLPYPLSDDNFEDYYQTKHKTVAKGKSIMKYGMSRKYMKVFKQKDKKYI